MPDVAPDSGSTEQTVHTRRTPRRCRQASAALELDPRGIGTQRSKLIAGRCGDPGPLSAGAVLPHSAGIGPLFQARTPVVSPGPMSGPPRTACSSTIAIPSGIPSTAELIRDAPGPWETKRQTRGPPRTVRDVRDGSDETLNPQVLGSNPKGRTTSEAGAIASGPPAARSRPRSANANLGRRIGSGRSGRRPERSPWSVRLERTRRTDVNGFLVRRSQGNARSRGDAAGARGLAPRQTQGGPALPGQRRAYARYRAGSRTRRATRPGRSRRSGWRLPCRVRVLTRDGLRRVLRSFVYLAVRRVSR